MSCTSCRLHETCTNVLQMGKGKKTAKIMVVQENPLERENTRKEYMKGKAGNLFRTALGEVGIDIEDVYFTALVKCSTPEDRFPLPDEVKACQDYLLAEIDIIKPEIVIPTGNLSMKSLMGVTAITKHRGKVVEKDGIKYMPILHPTMVLKQPKYMDLFSEDMITLGQLVHGEEVEGRESIERERLYADTYEEAINEIKRLIALPPGHMVSLDLETTKSNPFLSEVTMSRASLEKYPESRINKVSAIGFSDRVGYGCAIPLYHRQNKMSGNQIGTIIKFLRVLLEREDIEWTTQNGKFEIKWLRKQLGINLDYVSWDSMLMHYLAITEEKGTHDLSQFSWIYTDMGGYDSELEACKPKGEDDQGNYDLIEWDVLKKYLADDCDVTLRVTEQWKPLIEDNPDFKWLWDNIMIPATYTLADIESHGVFVDQKWLTRLEKTYPEEIERIEKRLRQYPEVLEMEREWQSMWAERCALGKLKKAERTEEEHEKFVKWKKYDPNNKKGDGTKFNFGSTNQLKELLFERMGLTTVVLTDKGELSTSEDSLKYMSKQHEICEVILELRKVRHLYNNFVAGIQAQLTDEGLIHGNYNIHGTVTGRLSSNEPNMQQIPRTSNDVFSFQYYNEIKKLFSSRFGDDGVIFQFDYSQLELRILAVFTQDPTLIQLYRDGADLHTAVAADAFGVPLDEVSKDMRTAAKKIQFGIVYQESAQGLSEDLRSEGIDMSVRECERFISRYFKRFPMVEKWVKNIKRTALRDKQVKGLTNRIRRLASIDSVDKSIANEALRQAVNSPIQQSGSECTLMSLIVINDILKKREYKSRICITVHDSIVLDCLKSEAIEVAKIVKDVMENLSKYNEFFKFLGDVPIVSEMEVGYNYGEAFEGTIEQLEQKGIDGFIQEQMSKKLDKQWEKYRKAEEEGVTIPRYVTDYWEAI